MAERSDAFKAIQAKYAKPKTKTPVDTRPVTVIPRATPSPATVAKAPSSPVTVAKAPPPTQVAKAPVVVANPNPTIPTVEPMQPIPQPATVPISQPITQPPAQTPIPQYDYSSDIKSLMELQRQKAVTDLGAKRDTSLNALSDQERAISPMYNDKRNQSSTSSQLGAKNLAEYMAQRGQTTSGLSAQLEGQRVNALGNTYAGYNRDEANAFNDINSQRTDIQRGYANDLASTQMDLQAREMEKLMQARQMNDTQTRNDAIRQQEIDYQLGRDRVVDTRYDDQTTYNQSRDRLADTRYTDKEGMYKEDRQREIDKYEMDQYARSIAGLGDQMDYQAKINEFRNDDDPTNDRFIPLLEQERARKIEGQQQQEALQQQAQAKAQQDQRKEALDIVKMLGYVPQELSEIVGLLPDTRTMEYEKNLSGDAMEQARINIALANARNAQTATSNTQDERIFQREANYESDGQGGYRKKQVPTSEKDITSDLVKEGYSRLNSKIKDEYGYEKLRYTPYQLTEWVLNLPISDAQKDELGMRLGLPAPKENVGFQSFMDIINR